MKHDHVLRNDLQMKLRKEYQEYITRYEELVQRNIDHETAHNEALENPFTKFNSGCSCSRCSSN